MLHDYCHALMDNSREGIALVEVKTYLIREANPVLAEIAGRSLDAIIGRPCHEVFHKAAIGKTDKTE